MTLGRMRIQTDYVSIVEAAYRAQDSDERWLQGVLDMASPVLDLGGGLGFSLVREGHQERQVTLSSGIGRINDMLGSSWAAIQQLNDETYRSFFYPAQPVVLASKLVSGYTDSQRQLFSSLLQHAGANDLLGMLGYPGQGWVFAMFVAVAQVPLPRPLYVTLQRLRTHLEASLRLRLSPSDAVAVIRPDGKLAHVDTHAVSQASRTSLAAQASSIERARSSKERVDPHRALGLWRALVEGRWSLVERTESDGRRYYFAFENTPHVRSQRALSSLQTRVVELFLRGLTGKEVAYEVGLSQASISAMLQTVALRLGFAGRTELLRVGAGLQAARPACPAAALTEAEQEVLDLVRLGRTNREIASARNTSPNTVANQVASLRRKVGARSRRGLVVTDL